MYLCYVSLILIKFCWFFIEIQFGSVGQLGMALLITSDGSGDIATIFNTLGEDNVPGASLNGKKLS